MYHIYGITETVNKSRKSVAITDMYNVCLDMGSLQMELCKSLTLLTCMCNKGMNSKSCDFTILSG